MKQSRAHFYAKLFIHHVENFLGQIYPRKNPPQQVLIAVSGGADSMVLLWLATQFLKLGKLTKVRVAFVHHHTRKEQDEEALLVENFCQELGVPMVILHAAGLHAGQGNFEQAARKMRHALLLKALRPKEFLWMGHQLDDSWEWSCLQRLRSGDLKSSLGIPVLNQRIVRPLMCVTASQIRSLAKFACIPYLNDPSNSDLRFDRNFLRHQIRPPLGQRFPAYLKHYVHQSNQIAQHMGLSVLKQVSAQFNIYSSANGRLILGDLPPLNVLKTLVHELSQGDRGKLQVPLAKAISAIESGKKGPFDLSGGVKLLAAPQAYLLRCAGTPSPDQVWAKLLAKDLPKKVTAVSFEELEKIKASWVKREEFAAFFPCPLIVLEERNILKNLNCGVYDSLFPEVSKLCQEHNWGFISLFKCLHWWRLKGRKLPNRLRIVVLPDYIESLQD